MRRMVGCNYIYLTVSNRLHQCRSILFGFNRWIAAGLPLVQYALVSILELVHNQHISIEKLVQVTSHNVADRFGVIERGYLREGYWGDVVIIDMNQPCTDTPDKVLYKCGWSPFDGFEFRSSIDTTIVNGQVVYQHNQFPMTENIGQRLEFSA